MNIWCFSTLTGLLLVFKVLRCEEEAGKLELIHEVRGSSWEKGNFASE